MLLVQIIVLEITMVTGIIKPCTAFLHFENIAIFNCSLFFATVLVHLFVNDRSSCCLALVSMMGAECNSDPHKSNEEFHYL